MEGLVGNNTDNYKLTAGAQENNDIDSKTTLGTENELISFNSDINVLMQNIINNINDGEVNMWEVSNKKELIINDTTILKTNNYAYEAKPGLQKFSFIKSNKYKITNSADDNISINIKKKIKYIKKNKI